MRLHWVVIGWMLGVLCALTAEAIADGSPVVEFKTPREREYWGWLQECRIQLDETKRELDGERQKVQTATATCNLTCPPLPACPSVSCGPDWLVTAGGIGLGLGVGLVVGQHSCPSIVLGQ